MIVNSRCCDVCVDQVKLMGMQGLLLTSQPFVRIFFDQPGVILFGLLLILMTAATVLSFVLKNQHSLIYPFLGVTFLIHMTLMGILAFDLSGSVTRIYVTESMGAVSAIFSTHRWLIIQVPILLTFITLVIGWVCRNDLSEKHSKEYVFAMQVCILMSFLTVLAIGYESLI